MNPTATQPAPTRRRPTLVDLADPGRTVEVEAVVQRLVPDGKRDGTEVAAFGSSI